MVNRLLILVGVLLLNLSIFGQAKVHKVHIKIVQTTDVHGAIFPFDYIKNTTKNYSLASIAAFVNKEREKADQDVILLDNGDILQGQPIVYYSNFEEPDSLHVCAAAMNYMKYDAATIGNHDIEAGHNVYDKLNKEFNFPWLAANAVDKKTKKPYFKPYTILSKHGVKIAILGLITPAIPKWLPEKIWEGMEFEDMIQSAKKWTQYIKKNENPDVMIGLFHSGIEYTYNNESDTTYKNENASKLIALNVPGFDIIFAGHDHERFNQKILSKSGSNVLMLNPANSAQMAAVADIDLTWNNEDKNYVKNISGTLIESKDFLPDSNMLTYLKPYNDKVIKYVDRVIGENKNSISARESLFGNSAFIDFIQQVQMEISGADISFSAPLFFDFEIPSGPISVKDMFKLYRFENLLYCMVLSGQEIKDFLEYSSGLWFNQMKNENDALLKYHREENKVILDNPYYSFASAGGIKYTIDVSKPEGEKIKITNLASGKKFNLNKKYKVAINSYTGNGGGGHLTEGSKISKDELTKRIVFSTEKDLRYYIMRYIEKKGTINAIRQNNWSIIPEEWWLKAKERDYNLLFH